MRIGCAFRYRIIRAIHANKFTTMARIEARAIPDDHYSYNLKDLNTLLIALERFTAQNEIMRTKEAAKFLGIGKTKMYQMDQIPSHKLPGIAGKFYLKSELIDFIKKH